LSANSERIQSVLNIGKNLIGKNKCPGLEKEVDNRLARITEQWEFLVNKSTEKSLKLKEASKQQTFNAGVKDIEFWLGLVENQLQNEEYGRDLATVQNLLKKHQLVEADVNAHEEPIKELNTTADLFIENNLFDTEQIAKTKQSIDERFENVKDLVAQRRQRLSEANILFQFFRDIDDEEAWIKEKKLLVRSEDFGRDLTSVQNLRKKHKRLEAELVSHEPAIQAVHELGNKLQSESNIGTKDIEKRCEQLTTNWDELKQLTKERGNKLDESLAYANWCASIEEELSWLSEKQHVVASTECGATLAAAQGLAKKHDAFETDFRVHRDRVLDIIASGEALCANGNHHSSSIQDNVATSRDLVEKLTAAADARKARLADNWAMLQFFWKADVVESWIAEKQAQLKSDDVGHNLSSVQSLLAKHETLASGLQAFETEGIRTVVQLKDQLAATTAKSDNQESNTRIQLKYEQVMERWHALLATSDSRRSQLKV
jgi:spectrin alpha